MEHLGLRKPIGFRSSSETCNNLLLDFGHNNLDLPVKVFEIAGLREDADQRKLDAIGTYHQGMEAYFRGDFNGAINYFKQSEQLEWNTQNPSQLFIERCHTMVKNPPPADWDGVFVMTSK